VARPIVFVSDFGVRDEFVGTCHCVMARIAPDSRIIDLSHGVPPQDVQLGALLLADSVPFIPSDAVLLAVVDPGVGTSRRAIAVETSTGGHLVGPDNGLLSLAWRALGGAGRAVEISSPDVVLLPTSKTFHARDVFSPAAAHLAGGRALDTIGPSIDVDGLVSLRLTEPEVERRSIRSEVLDADRFGNVHVNVRFEHLAAAGLDEVGAFEIGGTAGSIKIRRATTYGELRRGEYGALIDSRGWFAVIRNGGNAAEGLGVQRGDQVWITPAD
jgi:S-adenosyl-L-methionine hydrolase (adenosine-forming)